MQQGWKYCESGILWRPTTGHHINFWTQPWIKPRLALRSLIQGPLLRHELASTISQYRSGSNLNFSTLYFDRPHHVLRLLQSVYFPQYTTVSDRFYWGLTPSGKFTVRSCYKNLAQLTHTSQPSTLAYALIWKVSLHPKIMHFLWLLHHGQLPTSCYLHNISCIPSPVCQLCNSGDVESITHLILTCSKVASFWEGVGILPQILSLAEPSKISLFLAGTFTFLTWQELHWNDPYIDFCGLLPVVYLDPTK